MATQQLPRRPGDQTFKKNDMLRLIDCAERKRLTNYRIDVRRDGLSLVVGELESKTNGTTNELDDWMAKKNAS
jgi:hypothetical protein